MSEEIKKTIPEWSKEYGVQIIDPKGWDDTDLRLWEREMTEEEFYQGMIRSAIIATKGGKLWDSYKNKKPQT